MNRGDLRPFSVADGMILVAATALGFAFMPTNWWDQLHHITATNSLPISLTFSIRCLVSPWFAWTIALGIIRLRLPRPPFRRLRCQPGIVAALAAGVMFVLAVPAFGLTHLQMTLPWASGGTQNHAWLGDSLWLLIVSVPPAIIGAWVVLWFSGRWRPEPSWIDRLGRGLGWGWILLSLAHTILTTLRWE